MLTRALQSIMLVLMALPLTSEAANQKLSDVVREELSKVFNGARIELTGQIRLVRSALPSRVEKVTYVNDNQRGEAVFNLLYAGSDEALEQTELRVPFSAAVTAWVAKRRIQPGEALAPELFRMEDVNVALGLARDLRGAIVPATTSLGGLEARQTIIEGQFVVSTAVRKIPDIRRGDSVRLQIYSGGLAISTSGISEEPAYLDEQVRVMTAKTKRELTGRLRADRTVEVRL